MSAVPFRAETHLIDEGTGIRQFLNPLAAVIYNAEHELVSIVGIDLFLHQVITITGAKNFVPLSVVGNRYFLALQIIASRSLAARWVIRPAAGAEGNR